MAEEQTAEEKAAEFRAILDEELAALEESFTRRLAESQGSLDDARAAGDAEGEELFGEGALGRVDTEQPQEIQDLIAQREGLLSDVRGDDSLIQARDEELARVRDQFEGLLQEAQDPNSPSARAARERGQLSIDRQLRGNLRNVAALGQARGTRANLGLVSDALQGSVDATAGLERDLQIDAADRRGRIVREGAAARSESLRRKEEAVDKQRGQVDGLTRRLEELQGAIRQDTLSRQLINLENRAAETFGRLSTSEGRVAQQLGLIAGTREQVLAESNSAEARRHQRESERLQEVEANKPPPSGGGGKSVMCVQYWKLGDLSDEILEGDFLYTLLEDRITDEVRMFYYMYSSVLTPYIDKKGLIYHAFRPFVIGWANEMAHRAGVEAAESNWLGKVMCTLGVPIHQALGTVFGWFGHTVEQKDNDPQIAKLFGTAASIWDRANMKAALRCNNVLKQVI